MPKAAGSIDSCHNVPGSAVDTGVGAGSSGSEGVDFEHKIITNERINTGKKIKNLFIINIP